MGSRELGGEARQVWGMPEGDRKSFWPGEDRELKAGA